MINILKAKRQTKKTISVSLTYVMLIMIALVCAGPFLWFLSTSIKTGQNIYDINPFSGHLSLANYQGVWQFMSIPQYFLNTIIITAGAIAIDVIIASLCAYPLALMKFPGKNVIMAALMASMIIPAAAGLVIKYLIISNAHLMNTFMGVILPNSLTVFSIILIRQAYLGIPKELMEAAKIDGASELRVWAKILLPGIRPTISTVVIFDFIAHWNDFLWPVIILQDPAKYPIATALQYLNGQFNYKFGYIAAGTIISIIPVIIIFLIFQKNYIEAVAGAVKG